MRWSVARQQWEHTLAAEQLFGLGVAGKPELPPSVQDLLDRIASLENRLDGALAGARTYASQAGESAAEVARLRGALERIAEVANCHCYCGLRVERCDDLAASNPADYCAGNVARRALVPVTDETKERVKL